MNRRKGTSSSLYRRGRTPRNHKFHHFLNNVGHDLDAVFTCTFNMGDTNHGVKCQPVSSERLALHRVYGFKRILTSRGYEYYFLSSAIWKPNAILPLGRSIDLFTFFIRFRQSQFLPVKFHPCLDLMNRNFGLLPTLITCTSGFQAVLTTKNYLLELAIRRALAFRQQLGVARNCKVNESMWWRKVFKRD